MVATVVSSSEKQITLQVTVTLGRSMLDNEEAIQEAVNALGNAATQKALEAFDTDGTPIQAGNVRMTTRGRIPKTYQTPYGEVTVARHLYQPAGGGRTYCPLDHDARIVVRSTPHFARMISSKYAEMSGVRRVLLDLKQNHGRSLSLGVVQDVADAVATVALLKEEAWAYVPADLPTTVASMSVGLDGTCMMLVNDGWREAMVGTIALYDQAGERLHTTYVAASPEHGKEVFLKTFAREAERATEAFPKATRVGLADGAAANWGFLEAHTEIQTLDFYHVAEYLTRAADAVFAGQPGERQAWLEQACHRLKHERGYAPRLLRDLRGFVDRPLEAAARTSLDAAITYIENHAHQMTYAENVKKNLPIGSGVTEAACKVIIKQRMCIGAARWSERGATTVLTLRCLTHTAGRWEQFWQKVDRYGFVS